MGGFPRESGVHLHLREKKLPHWPNVQWPSDLGKDLLPRLWEAQGGSVAVWIVSTGVVCLVPSKTCGDHLLRPILCTNQNELRPLAEGCQRGFQRPLAYLDTLTWCLCVSKTGRVEIRMMENGLGHDPPCRMTVTPTLLGPAPLRTRDAVRCLPFAADPLPPTLRC